MKTQMKTMRGKLFFKDNPGNILDKYDKNILHILNKLTEVNEKVDNTAQINTGLGFKIK